MYCRWSPNIYDGGEEGELPQKIWTQNTQQGSLYSPWLQLCKDIGHDHEDP